jgi:hypothetical protein
MKDERERQGSRKAGRRKKWLTQRTRGPEEGREGRGTWMGRMDRMEAGEGVARGRRET